MGTAQIVVDVVVCDVCGKQGTDLTRVKLGWDSQSWNVDLCPKDYAAVASKFDSWIANGEDAGASRSEPRPNGQTKTVKPVPKKAKGKGGTRSRASTSDRWDYLESKGFTRHRGRLTQQEQEALAKRR
jgi:hypothetical protein